MTMIFLLSFLRLNILKHKTKQKKGLQYETQMHDRFVVAYEVRNDTMVVAMAVNSTGWFGFGPSATGSMIGANPCVVINQGPDLLVFLVF